MACFPRYLTSTYPSATGKMSNQAFAKRFTFTTASYGMSLCPLPVKMSRSPTVKTSGAHFPWYRTAEALGRPSWLGPSVLRSTRGSSLIALWKLMSNFFTISQALELLKSLSDSCFDSSTASRASVVSFRKGWTSISCTCSANDIPTDWNSPGIMAWSSCAGQFQVHLWTPVSSSSYFRSPAQMTFSHSPMPIAPSPPSAIWAPCLATAVVTKSLKSLARVLGLCEFSSRSASVTLTASSSNKSGATFWTSWMHFSSCCRSGAVNFCSNSQKPRRSCKVHSRVPDAPRTTVPRSSEVRLAMRSRRLGFSGFSMDSMTCCCGISTQEEYRRRRRKQSSQQRQSIWENTRQKQHKAWQSASHSSLTLLPPNSSKVASTRS
mmetsp:Transcript_96589/g.133951  ORF Transcript_96589/g.133951 Transcript_96589/m.133951 type:complete len:378 (-) Transcript_96589:169-1302(-)